MNRAFAAILAAGVSAGSGAWAQEDQGPAVRSTVVVEERVVVSGQTPAQASGLTVSPRVETPADGVRRDAEALYSAGRLTPLAQPVQPADTVVQVDGLVTTERRGSGSTACVQIGAVGARAKCRPGKP